MVDILTLDPGALVRLRFSYGEDLEDAVFLGLTDDGHARFAQAIPDSRLGNLFTITVWPSVDEWCLAGGSVTLEVVEVVKSFPLRA